MVSSKWRRRKARQIASAPKAPPPARFTGHLIATYRKNPILLTLAVIMLVAAVAGVAMHIARVVENARIAREILREPLDTTADLVRLPDVARSSYHQGRFSAAAFSTTVLPAYRYQVRNRDGVRTAYGGEIRSDTATRFTRGRIHIGDISPSVLQRSTIRVYYARNNPSACAPLPLKALQGYASPLPYYVTAALLLAAIVLLLTKIGVPYVLHFLDEDDRDLRE